MAAKAQKTASKPASKITPASLQRWNKYLAILYAVQGLVILVLSTSRTFPVTTNFLSVDTLQTQAQGNTVLAAGSHLLFSVNLAFVVAAFLFMAAIAHGLAATVLRPMYEQDLKKRLNKIRWIEYAFSASTMAVAVGLLVGIQDMSTLLMLFGLVAVASLFGLTLDTRLAAQKQHWVSCAIAGITGLLPWIVVVTYLIGSSMYGATTQGYIWWIVGTMFVLFAGFVANAYAQHRKVGNWTDYLYAERVFMILSLVAKTALAWQIFAGSLRP